MVSLTTLILGGALIGWHPASATVELPLWPEDGGVASGPSETAQSGGDLIGGKPVLVVENVSHPTVAVFAPPPDKNTGTAVVVFPGGGYKILAIDLEGTEVCDWLVPKGVTCAVVKYRVPEPTLWSKSTNPSPYRESPMALQDALRSIALVRARAAEWHIDPHKIGVLGFSAGGHLVAATSNTTDASSRPDFAVALYPGHLWREGALTLNPNIHVTAKTPPTFLLQAEDDPVDDVRNTVAYFVALRAAGASVEMHVYARGGHAFGLRKSAQPITGWPALVETWLRQLRMLPQ